MTNNTLGARSPGRGLAGPALLLLAGLAVALGTPQAAGRPSATTSMSGSSPQLRVSMAGSAAFSSAPSGGSSSAPAGFSSAPSPAPSPVRGPRWVWPLAPRPRVVRGFEPADSPWGPGHRGVDLLGTAGQPVLATGDAVVTFAGMVAGRGVVSLAHVPAGARPGSDTIWTTYEPVRSAVRVGDRVSAGGRLGALSPVMSHCAPRACLHWGARKGAAYLDPLGLVGTGRPRLLPLIPRARAGPFGAGSPARAPPLPGRPPARLTPAGGPGGRPG